MTSKILNIVFDRVMLLNASALTLSFMEIEAILKVVLLIFSIIYTIVKIIFGKEGNPTINEYINNIFSKSSKDKK